VRIGLESDKFDIFSDECPYFKSGKMGGYDDDDNKEFLELI
jgi:hypothetical protein